MSYRAGLRLMPNWPVMRDVAREGDWIERAIHAQAPADAAADVQAAITDLRHAASYWTTEKQPMEAARVQGVIDRLQGFLADVQAPGVDLAAWQARLYAYQADPRQAWRLYLDASGYVPVAVIAAAEVGGASGLLWGLLGGFGGSLAAMGTVGLIRWLRGGRLHGRRRA